MSQAILSATTNRAVPRPLSPRLLLAAAVVFGAGAGFYATPHSVSAPAIAAAGPELVRLLRAMAVLKLLVVAGAAVFADWRLRFPARPGLVAGYIGSLAVMATGPGLIWSMAHVVLGAVLLHGAFATMLVLFWRDPGSPAMLPARKR